jgi:hypothetical protein
VNPLLLSGVAAILALAFSSFFLARRRIRTGPENNWRNEAYMAREETGSWTENECAIGREDRAGSSYIPAGD